MYIVSCPLNIIVAQFFIIAIKNNRSQVIIKITETIVQLTQSHQSFVALNLRLNEITHRHQSVNNYRRISVN